MKKKWLSILLSLSMLAGGIVPAGSVYAEDMFVSDSQEMYQETEAADVYGFIETDGGAAYADEFSDNETDVFGDGAEPEDEFIDDSEIEVSLFGDEAEGIKLPSYIFGETWNKTYDVLYHEAEKAYVYDGRQVTFQDENTVLVGTEEYTIKNKETTVTVNTDEKGNVSVSLSGLSTPVSQISGKWNSSYAGTIQTVYKTDIPEMETVNSEKLSDAINLGVLPAGTYHLTQGVIYEKANQWSPGYDFEDGAGTVTERNFGYLPDVTVTVAGETQEEPDAYLGVNAGSGVPESFTNDLWLQYDYLEMEIGGTAKINPRRVEEGITDAISNNVEYPNFNYQIIKGDSVTIDTSVNRHAVVTAVKDGVTVVQVTYDAFDHTAGKHFDAVDPVNTAYVVYSVGGNKDIAITDNIVQKDDDKKNGDDVVFRSYDTLYYTSGETVPFTLKASAEGAENLVVKCNGITVQASASGTWVLPLENRSNIVELKATAADGTVRTKYHVLDARKIKINVENKTNPGEVLRAGDTATVSFTGITMPVYKLATIYNPCMNAWGAKATNVHYVCNGTTYTGSCSQWDLATKNSFDVELTNAGTYTFTNGSIYCEWWGSSLGYDKTTDDPGAPNLSAPINKGEFSFMPDFSIEAEAGIEVESVTLDKNELTLEYGESEQLTATVSPDGAQKVNWKSDNEDVAKVNDSGLVTAISAGTTVITAEAGDKTAQCKVTVNRPVLKEIGFTEKSVCIYRTQTHALELVYDPSFVLEEDKKVTYISTDDTIASVDKDGIITGIKAGNVTITAVSDINKSITAEIPVEIKEIAMESISLNKESISLKQGTSETLTVSITPEIIMDTAVFHWTSSDESVAHVTENGKIIAIKAGNCTISVQAEGYEKSVSCKVTVEETEPLELTASLVPEKVYDGDAVTLTIEGLEKPEEVTNGGTLWSEKINYSTDIPAMNSISGSGRETITFRVPENTPSGTYYLTDGNYYANFGGTKVQGVFLVGNTEKTFYEGQMPVFTLQVVCRAELRAAAMKELETYVDLADYQQEQQIFIQNILDQARESLETLNDEESIQQLVDKTKSLLSSIKTSSQINEEKLSAAKENAGKMLDSYVNLNDYRQPQQESISLIIALAKLNVAAASTQQEIDRIVEEAKADIDQIKTDAELRAEEQQSATPTPTPVTTKTQLLLLKVTAGQTTAKLTWNKISGADGYQIYGAKCGNSYKLLKTVKNTTLTWKQSKLKKGTYYKYYVVAYKKVNGKNVKISKSENMHIVTTGGKYGNAKKVTVNKSSVSVKKGKTYQLEAKVTNTSKYAKYHARSVRFVTDNPSVARVSNSGKIKGISKGTCYVYCFANNGIYKKVRITVK